MSLKQRILDICLRDSIPHHQGGVAFELAEKLEILCEQVWSTILHEEKDQVEIEMMCIQPQRDLSFVVDVKGTITFYQMDQRQHPPSCKSGFNPSEDKVIELIDWLMK